MEDAEPELHGFQGWYDRVVATPRGVRVSLPSLVAVYTALGLDDHLLCVKLPEATTVADCDAASPSDVL